MIEANKTWNAATDAQLRAAAAGVCGFGKPMPRVRCSDGELSAAFYEKGPGVDCWTPDTDRDQLARVFVAASEKLILSSRHRNAPQLLLELWWTALTSPRAALCALLDLLQVPLPDHE